MSIRSRVHEYGGGAMCLVPRRTGRRVRLRRADRAAGLVLRRPGQRRLVPARGAAGPHGRPPRRRGPQPRRARRHARRRLGPGGPRGPPPGPATPGPERGGPVDPWGRAERVHAARGARFLRGPAGRRRTAPGWPSWSGTTPTCRGTRSTVVVLPARPDAGLGSAGADTLARRVRRGAVAGGPEEAVGQPAWRARRNPALRVRPDGVVAALRARGTARRGCASRGRSPTGPPSSTGRTGSSGRRRWRTSPTARSSARMTASGRDCLLALAAGAGLDPAPGRRRPWISRACPSRRSARTGTGWR